MSSFGTEHSKPIELFSRAFDDEHRIRVDRNIGVRGENMNGPVRCMATHADYKQTVPPAQIEISKRLANKVGRDFDSFDAVPFGKLHVVAPLRAPFLPVDEHQSEVARIEKLPVVQVQDVAASNDSNEFAVRDDGKLRKLARGKEEKLKELYLKRKSQKKEI